MIKEKILEDFKKTIVANNKGRDRKVININPSSLYKFCSRKFLLCDKYELTEPAMDVGFGLAVTFEIGRAIEEIFFKNCSSVLTDCTNDAIKVKKSGFTFSGKIDCYNEIDGILYINELKSIKVKSADKDDSVNFDTITEPIINNWLQTQLYLWMINQKTVTLASGLPIEKINKDIALVTYIAKGHKYTPCKIFEVERDTKFTKMITSILKDLRLYRKEDKMAEKVCNSKYHPMAKQCCAIDFCWDKE